MRAFAISYEGIQPTFRTIQTDLGTFPMASGPNDVLTLTGSGITITGNSATKTVTFAVSASGIIGGANTQVQYNDSGVFDGDSSFTFTKATDVVNVTSISLVPQATRWFTVFAPTGQASPVIEVKSNGTQVAYISDLGNCRFQNVLAGNGLSTDTLAAFNTGTVATTVPIIPNSDNSQTIGNGSNRFATIAGVVGQFDICFAYTDLELPNQGTSGLKWQSNSHSVRWEMGNDSGSDQVWTWPGDYGSGGIFQIDGAGAITIVAAPTAPGIGAVLDVSNDVGGRDVINFGDIYPVSDNTYNNGDPSFKWANTYSQSFQGNNIDVAQITMANGAGDLTLGSATSDRLRFQAGDAGGTPSNTLTPAKWITCKDGGGTTSYIPLYT